MFLLPAAERYRRHLWFTVWCVGLAALALWRPAALDRAAALLLRPVAGLLVPAAGYAADRLRLDELEAAAPPPPPDGGLLAFERRLGAPPAAAGVAWLEVPVQEYRRGSGKALLAAGAEHGLSVGQPVAFGEQYLGAISEVGAGWSELTFWTAADAWTSVWLPGQEGPAGALCMGRGEGRAPVLRYPDFHALPEEGMSLIWRPPPEGYPPEFDLPLRVGRLVSRGDRRRGERTWEAEWEMPRGAEGRVFVGASAVHPGRLAEPPVARAPAEWVLCADGVFGDRLAAARCAEPREGILMQDGRVFGSVVATAGRLLWAQRAGPEFWLEEAVAVDVGGGRIRLVKGLAAGELGGAQLYTRGGGPIPRGLWLGSRGEPPAAPRDGVLELQARTELEREPQP